MSNENAPLFRSYQKLRKIVLFIIIIEDKCNVFGQKFQFQWLRKHMT